MRILFDHNVDRRFRKHLPGHEIRTAREQGWDRLANGVLLKTAAASRFEAFVSIDKKLEHEQNLFTLPLPVVVIDSPSTALPKLIPFAAALLVLLQSPLEPVLYVLQTDNTVLRLTRPRS